MSRVLGVHVLGVHVVAERLGEVVVGMRSVGTHGRVRFPDLAERPEVGEYAGSFVGCRVSVDRVAVASSFLPREEAAANSVLL